MRYVVSAGLGFADEVFRDLATAYPNVSIRVINAGDMAQSMIRPVGSSDSDVNRQASASPVTGQFLEDSSNIGATSGADRNAVSTTDVPGR